MMKKILIILFFSAICFEIKAQTTLLQSYLYIIQSYRGQKDSVFFAGDSVRNVTNKLYYTFNRTIKAPSIQIGSGIISPPESYEHEIATDGENNITVPFVLKSTTLVSYNGSIIGLARWQGIGTNTLTLNFSIKKYDQITIKN